jgi:adenylate cyclase
MIEGGMLRMSRLHDLITSERMHGLAVPAWIERLISVGIVATDPQIVRLQRCTNVAAFAIAANSTSHLLINAVYDFDGLLIVNIYNALMTLAVLCIPMLHRVGKNVAAFALVVMALAGNTFVVWALGLTSDLHVYFTLAGAILFMVGVQNWRLFLGLLALAVAVLLFNLNFAPIDGFIMPADGHLRDLLSSQAMINTIVTNSAMIFYALTALRKAEVELEQQYRRSDALVTTILPESVAARLRSGAETRIADRIETLSVMFTDLVGFTTASHGLPPGEVVDFLDRLVRGFETLCDAHGVDKIKTIGDGCMAVGGLDGRAKAGALAIGRLALAMMEHNAAAAPLGNRRLALRVGLHCGEAMAGVIGGTRFSYDVWGDAVNLAARMESHGETGRIQVSDAFRKLTADAFVFEPRGSVDIKGIGEMPTFYLVREFSRT